MRRVILAIALTATGLVLLLSYRTPDQFTAATGPTTTGATPTGATTSTGQVSDTPYGPVQVEVTVRDGRIVDIRTLRLPDANAHDVQLANYAVPRLRQEAIDAQSADIDVVSGATYTSEGYINSLQSALDQARR